MAGDIRSRREAEAAKRRRKKRPPIVTPPPVSRPSSDLGRRIPVSAPIVEPERPRIDDPAKYYDPSTGYGRGMQTLDFPGIGSPFVQGGPEPGKEFEETAAALGVPFRQTTYQAMLHDQDLTDLRWAWRQLHNGSDPSAPMMARLVKFLTKSGVIGAEGTYGTYDADEREKRRQRYKQVLAPTRQALTGERILGLEHGDTLNRFNQLISFWDENGGNVFAPSAADSAWGVDIPQANDSGLAYLRSEAYASELHDRDVTRDQMLQHISMTTDVKYFKQELAARLKEQYEEFPDKVVLPGGTEVQRKPWPGVHFDPNSAEWDANSDAAARQYLIAGQLKYLAGKDEEQKNRAWAVIDGIPGDPTHPGLLTDVYGEKSEEVRTFLKDLMRSARDLGISPEMKEYLYEASLYGRPLGTSAIQARWDYVGVVGRENVPQRIQPQLEKEQFTFGSFMMLPIDITTKLLDRMQEKYRDNVVVGPAVDAANFLWDNVNEGLLTGLGTAAGIAESVALGRPMANMIGLAIGTHEVDEQGNIVPTEAALNGEPDISWDWGALTTAKNWAASIVATRNEAGMALGAYADDVYLLLGKGDRATDSSGLAQLIGAGTALGDLYLAVKFGSKLDKGSRWGIKKGAEGTRYAGRYVWDLAHMTREQRRAAQRGEWVFYVPKEKIANIPEGNLSRIEELQGEAAEIFREQGLEGGAKEVIISNIDQPMTLKDVRAYIKAKGGIKRDNPFFDNGISDRENQGRFKQTLVGRGKSGGMSIDDLAAQLAIDSPGLGIREGEDLFEYLKNATPEETTPGRARQKTEATKRLTEIENEINYLLTNEPLVPFPKQAERPVEPEFLEGAEAPKAAEAGVKASELVKDVAETPKSELAHCYVDAARYVRDKAPDATVVHGSVIGAKGERILHAWVELKDGDIYDATVAHKIIPREEWAYLKPIEYGRFTRQEALLNSMPARFGHMGPWAGPESTGPVTTAEAGVKVRVGQAGSPEGLASLQREGYVYRGMTQAEYDATLGKGKALGSTKQYSLKGEGTSFAERVDDAESYIDFGRDDPRVTGKPTYIVEVVKSNRLVRNRQGYYEASDVVPASSVERVWKIEPDANGDLIANRVNAADVKVREVPVGDRAAEAESFYTDVVADMRGSGDVVDAALKDFHPADVKEPLPGILGETETQLRYRYAMDEAMRRTLADNGAMVRTIDRTAVERLFDGLPVEARTKRVWENLADVLDERGLWEGVKTAQVDAGIAVEIGRLNDAGYKTYGSHSGLLEDHPPGTAARKSEPYVEFLAKDLTRDQIRQVTGTAKRLDMKIERNKAIVDGVEHSTILVRGEVKTFTDALLEGKEVKPAAPAPQPAAARPAEPGRPVEPTPFGMEAGINEELALTEFKPGEPPPAVPPGQAAGPEAWNLAGGGPPETPVAPAATIPQPQAKGQRYPWWLENKAEIVAHHLHDKNMTWFVAQLLGLADDYAAKPEHIRLIEEMLDSTDADHVAGLMKQVQPDVNAMASGMAYYLRNRWQMSQARADLPNLFRAMTTFVPYDVTVPSVETARHLSNFALITKLGKENPTAADYYQAGLIIDRAWRSTDKWERESAIRELDRMVMDNMKAEKRWVGGEEVSTWDNYVKFRSRIRTYLGKTADAMLGPLERRAYGKGDRRRVMDYDAFDIGAEIESYKARLWRMAENAGDRKAVQRALDLAEAKLEQFRKDAKTWNDYLDSGVEYEKASEAVKAAGARLESLAAPQPLYTFQLKKYLQHDKEINPRLLASYFGGAPARMMAKGNAMFGDRIMRAWKSWVMLGLGFPIRVNVGDEVWRLIPEGLFGQEFFTARAEAKRLFGRKTFAWDLAEQMVGKEFGHGRYRSLSRAEMNEMRTLQGGGSLSKAQQTRLAELEAKAEGVADRIISEQLFDNALADYAEYMSDDWVLMGPEGGPRYYRAYQDHFRQLVEEPFIKKWIEMGMPELPKEQMYSWIRRATEESPEGVALLTSRGIMDLNGRIRDGQGYNQLIESYADIITKISQNNYLREGAKTGRISISALQRIKVEDLEPIPVKMGISRHKGHQMWMSPFATMYEHVTLPLMSTINGRLRETFFADRYLKETKKLRDQGMTDPVEIHAVASEHALDYVNEVTFSRRTTVFEDINRNLIPFIASYRQFMVYWLKTFVKHPFAMSAAYTYNPLRGVTFAQLPFGLSGPAGFLQPFWMQQDFENPETGLKGIIKQSVPQINTFIASLVIAPIGAQLTNSDLSQVPLLGSTDPNMAPLEWPFGKLYYAYTGHALIPGKPILGRLVRPTASRDRRHLDFLRAIVRVDTPEWGASRATFDGGFLYDILKKIGFSRPEEMMTAVSKVGLMTLSYTPETLRKKYDGDEFMYTHPSESARAKYRQENPWYDDYLILTEESPSKDVAMKILERRPDLLAFLPSSTTSHGIGYQDDKKQFESAVARGLITYKTDEEFARDYVNLYIDIFGGHREGEGGVFVPYGGDLARVPAEKKLTKALKNADKLIKQAATEIADGNGKYRKSLIDLFKKSGERPNAVGDFVLHPLLVQWAKKNGINPVSLNTGVLTEQFEVAQGWGTYQGATQGAWEGVPGPSQDTLAGWNAFAKSGLITRYQADWLGRSSPYFERLQKAAVDADILNRQTMYGTKGNAIGTKVTESFRLTSTDLQTMGYNAGPAFDRAQAKVQQFYYKPGGWEDMKTKHGYSSSEAREARNKFFAYRERVMGKVEGGQAIIGGLTQTLAMDKYFTKVQGHSFGSGPKAETEQKLWNEYLNEALRRNPDMAKIRKIKSHFDKKLKGRLEERQRVNDWVAAIATAQDLRYQMRKSYSDYYEGPGNSAFSNYGKAKVAELEKLIKEFYEDDAGETRKGSLFFEDIQLYFVNAHDLAYKMLEWTYH